MTDDLAPGTDQHEPASILRHDLISPVNQILGYAELLLIEAEDRGASPLARSLRSIQDQGRLALEAIDDALIREPDPARRTDLAGLVDHVVGPSGAIVAACGELEGASDQAPDRQAFLEDLGRVRDAAVQLIEMVRRASEAAAGRVG